MYQKIRQEVKLYKIAQIELFSIRIARGLTFRRTVISSDCHAISTACNSTLERKLNVFGY